MKRCGRNRSTFTFLQTLNKSSSALSPCARLTSGTMWEWFTKDGVLKENYIQATKSGTTKKNPKQTCLNSRRIPS